VAFTGSAYGWREGLLAIPRLVVGNLITIFAAFRALRLYVGRSRPVWDKTRHIFPADVGA